MNKFLENKWLVSITSGILLGLSFPPINLSFLSIPAFVLFFILAEKSGNYKQTAYYSYAGFLVWNVATTYWLMMASFGAGISAILANSVLMTIPLCLARFFDKRFKSPYLIALLQASAWVAYEFLHHQWDLAWPWLAIGNAWSNQISLIQFISITGHLGISFWVVLTSALAVQAIRFKTQKLALATIASLLLLPTISLIDFAIETPTSGSGETVNVTVVQPNHDSYLTYGGMSGNREVLDSLFVVTEKHRFPDTDLVIWPENAIDVAVYMNSMTTNRIVDSAMAWNTNFIVGTGLYTEYDIDPPPLHRTSNSGRLYNVFNSSLYVKADGEKSRYDKNNLVPFVERVPFVDFLNKIDVFEWVDWGNIPSFGKGTTPDMLVTDTFSTPGLVCYDSVYPTWIREFVNDGADFITIITNDGWWGNSSGHLQHFSYARLRAIEFDRWVVRSANNGTSGIIRPDGSIEQKTDYWVRTGFSSTIPLIKTKTFYSRFGDWLPILCLILTISGWLWGRVRTNQSASNET